MCSLRRTLIAIAACLALLAPVPASAEADVERLMEWLGISAAARQADRIIGQNLRLLSQPPAGEALSDEQQQYLHSKLSAATGADTVLANTRAYIAQHLPVSSAKAERILMEPLAVRARNFDVAMEMAGSFEKFQSFTEQLQDNPPPEQRRALLRRLDNALRSSAIAALLQTEIEITSRLAAARLSDTSKPFQDNRLSSHRQAQRRQYMAEVAMQLNLFSYRYMQDEELSQYIALLEDSSIQELLDISEQGLLQGLEAGRAIALQ